MPDEPVRPFTSSLDVKASAEGPARLQHPECLTISGFLIREGMKTVDANALLQDVESDLQQSFRNKIFEALKNSYETIKTAVAERNN